MSLTLEELKVDKIKVFGPAEDRSLEQIKRCAEQAEYAVLCADHHAGYSQPIGAAIAYEQFISPSGVGYDIGCGNKAVSTNILAKDIDVPKVMDEIVRRISFGVGRKNNEPVDHPVLNEINCAEFTPQRELLDLASTQLGTVGSGNHYIDLLTDEKGVLWVGVHFGSRGFGHKTASGFLALAQGKEFNDRAGEGGMDAPPVLLDTQSALGQDYISAMQLAGRYAYAGRDIVVDKVLEILGGRALEEIHNHHNFAWQEEHFGLKFWVIRKGCTPAFPGQKGFVGATMAGISVILEGVDSDESREALYSTVHGAGRVMSRTQAAGKQKWVKDELGRRKPVRVSKGLIDFDQVQLEMKTKGIELRGGGSDEAPGAYKSLESVLEYHKDTVSILHRLTPIGVAMAGCNEYDPYKD